MTQPTTTTRRDLLRLGTSAAAYAAGAAIVTGGVALASEAKGESPAIDRRAWDAKFKRCADAKIAFDEDAEIYERVHAEWQASQPHGHDVDMRAFHSTPRAVVLERIDPDQHERELLATIGETYFPNEREKAADLASIESLRAYRRDLEAHAERFRIVEIAQRSDDLLDAYCDLQNELMALPAPDVAAVQWKLEIILERGKDGTTASWSHDYVKPILADVARLSGGEG